MGVDERVMLPESGYTNEGLTMDWLRHFVKHTRTETSGEWLLLLMDGHKSHITPQFALFALNHRIQLFVFPSHMTRVLQPLDVGVFRP